MIYFDHAATTPVSDGARKAMEPYFSKYFGNPSSIYELGREAKSALWDAREAAASYLGAKPSEIVFTSGATESNNFAIKGVAEAGAHIIKGVPHIITSSIEHHCVLDTVKYLEKNFGTEVTYLPVSKEGLVNPQDVKRSIKENTILVSVMMGNNEVGTLEPIAEIGDVVSAARKEREKAGSNVPIYFHSDAVQAFQYFDLNVDELGLDLLSLTAHKFYGPKGVGLLYIRQGTKITQQQRGGAQERNLRAGTENVPYIIGMVEAMREAKEDQVEGEKKISSITDYLTGRILKEIPETELLGPQNVAKRLPHIAAILFKRVEGESILINLDMAGIAASSGSACTSGSLEASHVTKAMGYSDLEAHGAVRFSTGKLNKKEDVDKLMEVLPGVIEKLRAMSPIK
jgi:cysteine desulfurase